MFPVACRPHGQGRDLAGEIDAWQAKTDLVHAAGYDPSTWLSSTQMAGGNTYACCVGAINQDGYIYRIKLNVAAATHSGWKFKIFRPTGPIYTALTFVSDTEIIVESTGEVTIDFASPIAVQIGDIPAIYVPTDDAIYSADHGYTQKSRVYAGDRIANTDFTTVCGAAEDIEFELFTHPPYLCVVGDSLMGVGNDGTRAGVYNWATPTWITQTQSFFVPGWDRTAQPVHWAQCLYPNMRYQNWSQGGSKLAAVASTQMPVVCALLPAVIIVGSATNDVSNGSTWATMQAGLDSIKAQADAIGARLLVCQVPPSTGFDDTKAVRARGTGSYGYNGNLDAWASANGVTVIRHRATVEGVGSLLGQVRESTNWDDDIITAIANDSAHLKPNGPQLYGERMAQYL